MTANDKSPWSADEKAYVEYLTAERSMFAWCLVALGGISSSEAISEAERFYTYEPASLPYRGLVFHDESWHWAMRTIFGDQYWISHPELESPSAEYRLESSRHFPNNENGA